MKHNQGLTVTELVVVLAVASFVMVSTTAYSLPLIARESTKSGIYQFESMLHLTKIEAAKRNRECYFVIFTRGRRIEVRDTMGTTITNDDRIITRANIPATVSFASPNAEPAIDFVGFGPPVRKAYAVYFLPYGTVSNEGGHVMLTGGDLYLKLSLWKAGGTQVETWTGSDWKMGL